MSATVADHLLERLAANGARRVYGYPGDGINASIRSEPRATVQRSGAAASAPHNRSQEEALVPDEQAINDAIDPQGART